jgi:hypothetical protein
MPCAKRWRGGETRGGREFKIITYGTGGLFSGVNLDDTSALLDIMDPPEEIRKKLIG